jgi:hypothetical protein
MVVAISGMASTIRNRKAAGVRNFIAYHKAMEVLYQPDTWDWDREVVGELAVKTFVDACNKQRETFLRDNNEPALEPAAQEDYDERVELGMGMLRYYYREQLPKYPEGFRPVKVEIPFEVPVMHPDTGQQIYCKCENCWIQSGKGKPKPSYYTADPYYDSWQGLPVVYSGRIDALGQDSDGWYYPIDWKHVHVDELILTPTGWTRMGNLNDGEYVIGQNGKPTRIVGASSVTEQKVWEVELYDGTIIECSGDHKWTIYDTYNGNALRTRTTEEMYTTPLKPSGCTYFGIPVTDVVEFHRVVKLPIHPYALGLLIAEGNFTSKRLAVSSKTGETIKLLEQYTPDDVIITDCRQYENNKWDITGPWREQLRELNLWGKYSADKFIPEDYLFASVEERILLLQGLYDGDGLASAMRICTVSMQLADDVAHLVRSLGGRASISHTKERVHSNGKTVNVPEYFVNFTIPDWIEHCQLEARKKAPRRKQGVYKRNIRAIRPTNRTANMRCIAVDNKDGLYVLRNFVVTHNTAARVSQDDEFLELDCQVASYSWALKVLGLPVRGFVYHEQKKGYPQPPAMNKHVRLGCSFSVNKNADTDYRTYLQTVREQDPQAYAAGYYDKHLEWLKHNGPTFFKRWFITKSYQELDNIGKDIGRLALDMTDPDLRIYPSPGRFSCQFCLYRQPCLGRMRGEDVDYYFKTCMKREAPYYMRQTHGPSTDSRGGE